MTTATDRLNRRVLSGLGALLTAGGALGLARSLGAFGQASASRPVLTGGMADFAERNDIWFWPLMAIVSLLVALLALRWLLVQLATERVGAVELETDRAHGSTVLRSSALSAAVEEEITTYAGVHGASARLLHDPHRPHLELRVSLEENADVAALRSRIEGEAVTHARQALGMEQLPVRLRLRVAAATPVRQVR